MLNSSDDVRSEYVFPNLYGMRMTQANLADRLRQAFAGLDLAKLVTPHVIRRSAAMNWLSRGMDIYDVSGSLGHEHITTTQ